MKKTKNTGFVWRATRIGFWLLIVTWLLSIFSKDEVNTIILIGFILILTSIFTFINSIIHLSKYKPKAFAIVVLIISSIVILISFVGFVYGLLSPLEIRSLNKSEISVYVDKLPYGVSSEYNNAIKDALSYWEKIENVSFKEVLTEGEADIVIYWTKEFGGDHLGYAYGNNFIEIGLGDSLCLGKWQPYTYDSILHITKHEMGHILGYEHSDIKDNIMYHNTSTKYELDFEESGILPEGWYQGYPVCSTNEKAEYTFTIESNESLNVYVVSSQEDYDKYGENKAFSHYAVCQEDYTKNYEKTCVVSNKSLVILENPYSGTEKNAQYIIKAKEN